MTEKVESEVVERLLAEVLRIEKKYAHELRNVKSDRRAEIRSAVDELSVRER